MKAPLRTTMIARHRRRDDSDENAVLTAGTSSRNTTTHTKTTVRGKKLKKGTSRSKLFVMVVGTIATMLLLASYIRMLDASWQSSSSHSTRGAQAAAIGTIQWQADAKFFERKDRLPVLIVGGSDGSGTRAVVETLRQLGVVVVADDPGTLDIHANTIFRKQGWPKFATTVLEATQGSLSYDFDKLPSSVREILEREVARLRTNIAQKYANEGRRLRVELNRESQTKKQGRRRRSLGKEAVALHYPHAKASKVAFLFKAPASMLVLPVLNHFMQPVQFLHVLRDGRDIALSDNQSPVLKFYNATYPQDYEERLALYQGDLYPVRGMQLWNDWNLQAHEWATTQVTSDMSRFQYSMVRTEDLVDPSTKYLALRQLANYVGSTLTPREVCCLARAPTKDHGQSTVHSENQNNFGNGATLRGARGGEYSHSYHHHSRRTEILDPQKRAKFGAMLAKWNAAGTPDDLNHHRRLLAEAVHTQFLKQLSIWQEHVRSTDAQEFQLETLEKLADYGKTLLKQLEVNQEALQGEVGAEEITESLQYLENLMRERTEGTAFHSKGSSKKAREKVHSRYGKWKTKLQDRPALSQRLHQEGKRGLAFFGYEPRQEWKYESKKNATEVDDRHFVCDAAVQCEWTAES